MIELGDALRSAAEIGPFFALATVADGAAWQPFAGLLHDPPVLRARIAATRDALAVSARQESVDWRVAASLAQLNLSARVLSPVLGCALVSGVLPAVSPDSLWWQPVLGGAFPLAFDPAAGIRIDRVDSRAATDAALAQLASTLTGLVDATSRVGGLSTQIGWGNVDSAVATALALIRRATGEPAARLPRRSTCCLFYRVSPGAGLCGDCVLALAPRRRGGGVARTRLVR